jgi:putative transposase
MPKKPRLKGPELYHHIYNRGNDRHPIFKKTSDYKRYLKYLFEYSDKYKIDILAYALLEWHIHLFIFDHLGKISEFFSVLHGRYAQVYNKIHNRIGHVFEGRFKNKIVDKNKYGLWLSRYIHRQAVEAGLVNSPEEYKWTSYQVYIGEEKNSLIKTNTILSQFGNNKDDCYTSYRKFVTSKDNGPINWEKVELSSQQVIGDVNLSKNEGFESQKTGESHEYEIEPKNLISLVSLYLGIPISMITHPKGKKQRKFRRQAIIILANKYSLGVREIARLLDMAPSSISAILNFKNEQKRTPAPDST